MIEFSCSNCGKPIRAPDGNVGKPGICAQCGASTTISLPTWGPCPKVRLPASQDFYPPPRHLLRPLNPPLNRPPSWEAVPVVGSLPKTNFYPPGFSTVAKTPEPIQAPRTTPSPVASLPVDSAPSANPPLFAPSPPPPVNPAPPAKSPTPAYKPAQIVKPRAVLVARY